MASSVLVLPLVAAGHGITHATHARHLHGPLPLWARHMHTGNLGPSRSPRPRHRGGCSLAGGGNSAVLLALALHQVQCQPADDWQKLVDFVVSLTTQFCEEVSMPFFGTSITTQLCEVSMPLFGYP